MTTTANNTTATRLQEQNSIDQASSQVGIGIIIALSGAIGVWGVTCMLSALSQYGANGMAQGWISAVTGG